MKWVHLIIGTVMFLVFTTTGSYMRADFPEKSLISPELPHSDALAAHLHTLFGVDPSGPRHLFTAALACHSPRAAMCRVGGVDRFERPAGLSFCC